MRNFRSPLFAALLVAPLLAGAQTLIVTTTVQDDACSEGVGCITADVSGGVPPYAFLWSPEPPAGQGTAICCGLVGGTYSLTVTDADGLDTTIAVTVGGTPGLLLDTSPGQAVACIDPCNGYWWRSGPVGGTAPYTVTVEPPAGNASANPNGVEANGMCVGQTYTVTVTDANGCVAVIEGITVVEVGPPQIVSINQQGFCQGFQWNSAQVVFDQPISQVTVVSGTGTINNIMGNTVHLYGLGVGWNVFNAIGVSPFCQQQFTIEVEDMTGPCGTIMGIVHADVDGNCVADATDPLVPHRMIRMQPGNLLAMTSAGGSYTQGAHHGTYTVGSTGTAFGADCISPYPVPVTISTQDLTVQVDLLLTPLGPDASAFISATGFRPGFPTTITAIAQNNSPYTVPGITLSVDYDPLLQLGALSEPADVNTSGHLEWILPDLPPFATATRTMSVNTPPTAGLIGTVVAFEATLSMPAPDADPLNDRYATTRIIVGAYDPNDKLAETSSRSSPDHYFIDQDGHMDFTIRFQNTGTAEAIDVYLLDTISPLFDLASFELLGASHAVEMSLLEDRVLRFDFPGIMLPDSASDPVGSQGFASFRLKPDGTPAIGAVLENAADIFFDFNEPIRTNTITLLVDVSTGISLSTVHDPLVFPNPATDRIHVRTPWRGSLTAEVWTMDGRMVVARTWLHDGGGLDISALPTGMYVLRASDTEGSRREARFVKH